MLIEGINIKRLNNKVAIVTGAASGMGRAIAILFAKEGVIFNIGSAASVFGSRAGFAYTASKHAVAA